jgi:hypothetical protein
MCLWRAFPYHEEDWSLIAGIGVDAVESGSSAPGLEAARLTRAGGGGDALVDRADWLFAHPIFTPNEWHELGNGLHRMSTMKTADAARCPVSVLS